jgi:hypothetical protein
MVWNSIAEAAAAAVAEGWRQGVGQSSGRLTKNFGVLWGCEGWCGVVRGVVVVTVA